MALFEFVASFCCDLEHFSFLLLFLLFDLQSFFTIHAHAIKHNLPDPLKPHLTGRIHAVFAALGNGPYL